MFIYSKQELEKGYQLYVLTITSLEIAGSFETGAFCLAKLPELNICPEIRLGFPDGQPEEVLASSPPAVESKNISNTHIPVEPRIIV